MDVRRVRTEQAITNCFLELLKEKAVSKITVTEICQLTGINRTTFYKHYLDVQDLQESLENKVLADFTTFLQESECVTDARYQTMIVRMLTYLKQYGPSFYLLCSQNAASELPAKTFRLMNSFAFPIMKGKIPTADEEKTKLLYQFLCHGCGALLVSWLREDCKMTVEEMADFIMTLSGVSVQMVSDFD